MMGMEGFTRIPGESETNGYMKPMGGDMEEIGRNNWDSQNEIRLHSVGGDFASLRFCKFAAGILPSTLDVVWCSLQEAITAKKQSLQMLSKMCIKNICRVTPDASKNANLTYPAPWFILWLWMKDQMKQ